MTEAQKTRRAAEIMKAWKNGESSAPNYVSVEELIEAGCWRLACELAEIGLTVEQAYVEMGNRIQ